MERIKLFYVLFIAFLLMSVSFKAYAGGIQVQKTSVNDLLSLAVELYELQLKFIDQYSSALKHVSQEAGEGLYAELFNDPIVLFKKILFLDENNLKAHLYLGKAYHRKAYEGEGNWNKDFAMKAKQEYLIVQALSKKIKVDKEVLKDIQSELKDVEEILKNTP